MLYLLGHKGFIGSAIANCLRFKKVKFIGIDRTNYNDFIGKKCDIFINADGSSKKRLAEKYPKKDFKLNVVSTLNSVIDFHFQKYILISSVDVYPDFSNPKNNRETAKINPAKLSNYGFSKWISEQIVRKYCNNWLIFRLGPMIGEGLKKNAIFDLLYKQALYINPQSVYQYINITEVARLIYLFKDKNKEVFNICGKGVVVLEEVADHLGIKLPKELFQLRKERYEVDITKASSFIKSDTKTTVFDFVNSFRK